MWLIAIDIDYKLQEFKEIQGTLQGRSEIGRGPGTMSRIRYVEKKREDARKGMTEQKVQSERDRTGKKQPDSRAVASLGTEE